MLFDQETLGRIAAGEVTLFRRWRRATVKAGGTLRTRVGVLAIESVEEVPLERVTEEDARRAGEPDRVSLLARLGDRGPVHRVAFHLAGPDPRIALRERGELSATERAELDARLARWDAAAPEGPWTATVLGLIAARPATRAADLAVELGWERLHFKARVRRLKELGLSESLERGYRLSPRGRAYFNA